MERGAAAPAAGSAFLWRPRAAAGPAGARPALPDLPSEPAVVALEFTPAENLLALGLMPAGVADIDGYRIYVGYRGDMLETAVDVGTRQEPSV